MVAKRALVVDDSKSARAFLARLLEEQHLEVDAAENAEQALDYLAHNRPDVIFMDHLMPGMDGFQAVQAIKSNPRTATIPILMYTSQEGELYLGQARALGAVGVLPKSVAPSDVYTVLQQLHLVPHSPTATVAVQQDVLEAAVAVADSVDSQVVPILQLPMDELLRDEVALLRRHLDDSLAAHSQRVVSEVRNLLLEAKPAPIELPPAEAESSGRSTFAWLVALAASVTAAVLGTLLWQHQQQLGTLQSELADSRSTVTMLAARLVPAPPPPVPDPLLDVPAVDGLQLVARVPFGEAPLSGARIDALRDFVARVATLGQKGTVEVRRHAGRFCLARSGPAGFALADGATPYSKCDLVAEATDPQLGNAGAESVAFANALAELRKQHADLLTIDVGAVRGEVGEPYPETIGVPPREPLAGEWNAVAENNNRVEIRWHPAS